MLIPKNTEEAQEIGKKLSRKEVLARWEEYKRSLRVSRKERLSYLRDCELGRPNLEFPKEMLKKSFREQMLREMSEGYLGSEKALTPKEIDEKLYGKSNNKNESM